METLVNLIKDAKQTLRRVQVTQSLDRSEKQLLAEISKLENECNSLESFESFLNEWMETTAIGNRYQMWTIYKLERDAKKVEVWHLNYKGDKDRLVCTLHDDSTMGTDQDVHADDPTTDEGETPIDDEDYFLTKLF